LTIEARNQELKGLNKLGTKSIDKLALAAALSWVAAMIGLSWWGGGDAILAWLIRGMWGAIFIYATCFLTLHAVVLKAQSKDGEDSPKEKKEKKEEIERDPLTDLQAADSGELARIVSENVTE
jgi:fatty acid desaturase